MKKILVPLILLLLVLSGWLFANREIKKDVSKMTIAKPPSASEKEAALKEWEATPAGINFKKWEASSMGKKVLSSADKISAETNAGTNIEAIVTALSLPPGSRLGFGVMVKIKDEDYILNFGADQPKEFQELHQLKVNDKIIIRSHFVSYAPKYAFPIVAGNYVEKDGKIIYKRQPQKGGC